MKLLADENVPAPVIVALRQRGHDVLAAAQAMPGASDAEVLAVAAQQARLLLTMDRDYGDLIFHRGHPAPRGVILFRLQGRRPEADNQRMLEILEQTREWNGRFTTVTDALIRSRTLGQSTQGQ